MIAVPLSITTLDADGPRDIVCPSCVIAGLPALSVWEPTTNWDDWLAVYVWLRTVI